MQRSVHACEDPGSLINLLQDFCCLQKRKRNAKCNSFTSSIVGSAVPLKVAATVLNYGNINLKHDFNLHKESYIFSAIHTEFHTEYF